MTLRVLDLFSGIGGFSLGLERTGGFKTVGFCEIDPFCRRVLAKHWPDVPCHDDITTRDFQKGEADVITGGFPCQDISFAGAGAGIAGSRSGLWRELVRAIRLVRPRVAIVENVAALLGRGMGTVLGDLAEIGYDAEWHCIPASAVGAPHRRDRVWIVADAGSEQHESHRAPLSGAIAPQLLGSDTDTATMLGTPFIRGEPDGNHTGSGEMADAAINGWIPRRQSDASEVKDWGQSDRGRGGGNVAYADGERLEVEFDGLAGECSTTIRSRGQWSSEPDVGRVAHGVPSRVDRLRSLGNAVVPQIPELIARAFLRSFAPEEGAAA